MSLDVYLNLKGYEYAPQFDAIFIRENGAQKQITRLVAFAEAYLSACENFPEAEVTVSR